MVYRSTPKIIFFLSLLLLTSLFGYQKPSDIPQEVWEQVTPYLIPENHKVKKTLDSLFLKTPFRILQSPEALTQAGFIPFGETHVSGIHVVSHNKISGCLIKLYLDGQDDRIDWQRLLERCKGRDWAEKVIRQEKATSYFIVPEKWLYLIPENSPPSLSPNPKHFILIVEKLSILNHDQNRVKWKSDSVTPKLLDAFFRVITKGGFADQNMVDNAPFCKNGKIAFIDTEIHHRWPIDYNKFTHYLSKKNRVFWVHLFTSP